VLGCVFTLSIALDCCICADVPSNVFSSVWRFLCGAIAWELIVLINLWVVKPAHHLCQMFSSLPSALTDWTCMPAVLVTRSTVTKNSPFSSLVMAKRPFQYLFASTLRGMNSPSWPRWLSVTGSWTMVTVHIELVWNSTDLQMPCHMSLIIIIVQIHNVHIVED